MASSIGIQLSFDTFRWSYDAFEDFPSKLICQTLHTAAMESYRARLEEDSPRLFAPEDNYKDVKFLDLEASGQAVKINIYKDVELKSWLATRSSLVPNAVPSPVSVIDPKCRFIFLHAVHSRARLNISKKSLVRILTYHQVMPSYLDFISIFGSQSQPRDLRFCGFREQTFLAPTSPRGPAVHCLGRSGFQFQLCYNLKTVALLKSHTVSTPMTQRWSIRQAAFHHQFDIETGTTLWLVTRGGLDIQEGIQDLIGDAGRPEDKAFGTVEECFKSSLAIHTYYAYWASENWRYYIRELESLIDQKTEPALHGRHDMNSGSQEFNPEDLQDVQTYEDRTNETIMVLEGNVEVLTSLREYYEHLLQDKHFPEALKASFNESISHFGRQLGNLIYDMKMQISRAKLLVRITSERKNLILHHFQNQSTRNMEAMNNHMRDIGEKSQREAVAMRVITVVTLIYLPATFVSTFFSTDVIKYQGEDPNGTFSSIAMMRWLQITLPLTLITLGVGFAFWSRATKLSKDGEEYINLYRYRPVDPEKKSCQTLDNLNVVRSTHPFSPMLGRIAKSFSWQKTELQTLPTLSPGGPTSVGLGLGANVV